MRARGKAATCLLGVVLACLAVVLPASPASAHVRVTLESPGDGARLETAPSELVVGFSEPMRLADVRVRLTDSAGRAVVDGPLDGEGELGTRGRLAVPASAAAASYVVSVTAQGLDGHIVVATFAFVVGQGPLVREEGGVAPDDALAVVGSSWLGGVATALGLVGAAGVGLWLLGPGRGRRRVLRPEVIALGPVCGIVGVLLKLSAARGARGVDSFGQVLSSQSGRMMLLGAVSWALFWAALLWWRASGDAGSVGREGLHQNVVLGLSVPLLLSVAGSSHAASDGWALVTLFAGMTHVAAMATWFGGLAGVALTHRSQRDWLGATRWFATTATVSAGLAVLSGALLAVRLTSGLDPDVLVSTYGLVLAGKLALVALLLVAALHTRSRVRRAHGGVSAPEGHAPTRCVPCRSAALAVRRELAAAGAVLVAGTLLSVLAT